MLEGIVRAKQDMIDKGEEGFTVLPVLLHGDSAFAGQGVVAETLNLSQLRGYRTGGTVHVVINNQVGFTTSPAAARSSLYSTDVARMINAPIFHVNGDDPEACVRVARLAVEYRQAFKKDVVIDLVCYRRRGHNEGDDPSMTQPLMYDIIDRKRSVRKLYTEALVGRGDITLQEAEEALKDYRGQLERAFAETHDAQDSSKPEPVMDPRTPQESHGPDGDHARGAQGHRRRARLLPAGLHPAPEAASGCWSGARPWPARAASTGRWASCSPSARCSCRASRCGWPARTPGAARSSSGTRCSSTGRPARSTRRWRTSPRTRPSSSSTTRCCPSTRRWASSTATRWPTRKALVLWEAQFGDFVDGAQMVIDEFISSGEAKWGQRSGVVLLLPHGLEGQGPDHSSGRIERFLQLSAENNMTVANCTTPANYFHLLRRQALSESTGRWSSSRRSRCCGPRRRSARWRTSPSRTSARCCPTRASAGSRWTTPR